MSRPHLSRNPSKTSSIATTSTSSSFFTHFLISHIHSTIHSSFRVQFPYPSTKKEGTPMALITCPDCGKQISEHAESCPNCGCPSSYFPASKVYALLYNDGHLVFQSTGEALSKYGTGATCLGEVNLNGYPDADYMPWCNSRSSITSVSFDMYMAPKSTASWFNDMTNLTSIDFTNLDTSNVTDMIFMFYNCRSLTSLDLSGFNTQNVTIMSSMFCGCSKLTSLDLSSFNTQNVTHMGSMFYDCSSLTSLDLSSFDTQNVKSMYCMFSNCSSLTSLDLSSFDTRNATKMGCMFSDCSSLTNLVAPRKIQEEWEKDRRK